MPYRLIVTDLMNRTAKPTETLHGPTPRVGDFISTRAGKAKVTKVEEHAPEDYVYAKFNSGAPVKSRRGAHQCAYPDSVCQKGSPYCLLGKRSPH